VLASAEVDGYDLVLRAGLLQRRHAPRHVPRHRRAVQLHRSHAFSLSLCLSTLLFSLRASVSICRLARFTPFNRRRVCGFGSDLTAGAGVENLRDSGLMVEWEPVGGAGVWPARSRV
jgi:hypothetical protein